ncbi:MAG: PAS domain S-box protein [Proteobacteria bacterium]|jgi:diguanylate cyclase (GGDEF)-like protein/PAS domain S-box-containing protein|nr:PAS domain S-box protein [Desulfocapsa sp.]MBU3946581.1 PAS domain S-box protein [Pseudomonadota bacterium]MCG2742814.1 PAS domain S-box protein [Desulfobacteraceae bacterium]MBU3983581.1 PAS domain S-box protein [Pseudomonadota bacterium]MBU4029392.1 PAS domain S-box protein [Pseudomonadota bacterium]
MDDLTKTKLEADALHKANVELSLLRKLLDHSSDAIEVIDPLTLRFLDVNETACRDLGYSRAELLSMSLCDIDSGLNPEGYKFIEEQKLKSGAARFETSYRRKDGSIFAVEVSVGFVNLDKPYGLCIVRDITARKRTSLALRQSEEKYRALVESTSDWIWEMDQNGNYTYVSPRVETMLGYTPEELLGKSPFDLMSPEEGQRVAEVLGEIIKKREPIVALENINLHKNGRLVVLESCGVPFFDSNGEFAGYRGIDRDITERKQVQEEIIRLASFPTLHPSPVIELDAAGEISYLNPAAENLFPKLGALGQSHPLLHSTAEQINALRQGKERGEIVDEVKIGKATYELHISYVHDVNLIRIYVMDITQRKRDEEAIYLLATTDSLTGIANRREFTSILVREMDQSKRYGTPMALTMYDLDYFKCVNDTFGHDVGDYVLLAITGLVKENIRVSDIVGRWGGEEFMVLMPQSDIESARNTAEKLRLAIASYHFDKVDTLTVSFGVTVFEPQDDLTSLLKRVDDALYQAKNKGRNRVEVLIGDVASH